MTLVKLFATYLIADGLVKLITGAVTLRRRQGGDEE